MKLRGLPSAALQSALRATADTVGQTLQAMCTWRILGRLPMPRCPSSLSPATPCTYLQQAQADRHPSPPSRSVLRQVIMALPICP